MPSLEVASIDNFIEAMGEDTAMFWGIDQPLQDDKKEPMIGLLLVVSCNHNGSVIRYVENMGTAYTKKEKELTEAMNKRTERVKIIQKSFADKGKDYGTGLWANE